MIGNYPIIVTFLFENDFENKNALISRELIQYL